MLEQRGIHTQICTFSASLASVKELWKLFADVDICIGKLQPFYPSVSSYLLTPTRLQVCMERDWATVSSCLKGKAIVHPTAYEIVNMLGATMFVSVCIFTVLLTFSFVFAEA